MVHDLVNYTCGCPLSSACHYSCASCNGETRLHCATCKSGAILENGKCVSQCSPGYYEEVTICKSKWIM